MTFQLGLENLLMLDLTQAVTCGMFIGCIGAHIQSCHQVTSILCLQKWCHHVTLHLGVAYFKITHRGDIDCLS